MLKQLDEKISTSKESESEEDSAGISIERDENGLVKSVNGKPVKRDDKGLIAGLED